MRIVLDGPDPEASGLQPTRRGPGQYLRPALRQADASLVARTAAEASRVLATEDAPEPSAKNSAAQAALKRAGAAQKNTAYAKNKRIRLFFQDEARIGQKGRTCHVWWRRGERPPGLCDKRFTSPTSSQPSSREPTTPCARHAVREYRGDAGVLDHFAATIGDDEHVAMVLDQAGWHASGALRSPTTSRWCRCRPTRPS